MLIRTFTKTCYKIYDLFLYTDGVYILQRDSEFMKNFFKDCVLETIYPLLHDVNLKPYKAGNVQIEEASLHFCLFLLNTRNCNYKFMFYWFVLFIDSVNWKCVKSICLFTGFEHQVFLLQERHTEIQNFITKKADRKGILALLLSAEIEFSPLDMKEVAFDVIGSHCLVPDTHVSLFYTMYKFTCYLITLGLLIYMYIVGEYLMNFKISVNMSI